MKKIFIAIIGVMLLAGCAGMGVLPEDSLAKRLISSDSSTRTDAVEEFAGLNDYDKRKNALELVSMLRYEYEPAVTAKIAQALKDIKAESYVIEPLIRAVKDNGKLVEIGALNDFIVNNANVSEDDIFKLQQFLKDDRWEVRRLAMLSAVKLKKKAEILIPELIMSMEKFGDDPEKYYELYDTIAGINPEVAITRLIIDLKNNSETIKQAAFEGLFQLQVYLDKNNKLKKEIMPALIRAMYTGKDALSEAAEKLLVNLEKKDADEIRAFLKAGKMAFTGLMKFTGKNMEEVFKEQEVKMEKRMNEFYESIGRKDAIGQ
jgi:hypothetical protein